MFYELCDGLGSWAACRRRVYDEATSVTGHETRCRVAVGRRETIKDAQPALCQNYGRFAASSKDRSILASFHQSHLMEPRKEFDGSTSCVSREVKDIALTS